MELILIFLRGLIRRIPKTAQAGVSFSFFPPFNSLCLAGQGRAFLQALELDGL
jgi:hypothetical protein